MKITLVNGRPAILADDGKVLLGDITCGIRYSEDARGGNTHFTDSQWTLTETDGDTVLTCGEAVITFRPEGRGYTFSTEYTYDGEDVEFTDSFVFLAGQLVSMPRMTIGSEVRESNGNKTNEMLTHAYTFDMKTAGIQEFGDFCAFHDEEGRKVLAGFLTSNEYFGGIYLTPDGYFECRGLTERHETPKGKTLKSDLFYITECEDIPKELPEYCSLAVKYICGEPRLRFDTPTGYCSWYYYLAEISEKVISNALKDLMDNKDSLPVKYFQIDDGWQICYGNWEPNEKFPNGMKSAADQIKAAGFVPGIWFAPLWARIAPVAKEHPEYFAKDRKTGEQTVCFDYSVPETCEFISEIFRRATYDWGYKYLKLDLITTCLGAYRYSDPEFNSLKNYKKCLEVISAAVPEDTFILGCTAPFMPSVGLVDGMRISCDIGHDWEAVKEVMSRVHKRYFYHKRFFISDADCLIIRKSENEDEECQRRCTRNDDELRSYISATAAAGGVLMFSDKLRLLSDEQMKTLASLFPANDDPATPLDLMEESIPCVLDCGVRGNARTVMLINWTDEDKLLGVDTGDSHVFEFWTKSYRGRVGGRYETTLAPHCCEVLFLTEGDGPAVVGTDSTIIPRLTQKLDADTLKVTFTKADETLFLRADSVKGDGCEITSLGDGIFALRQTGSPDVELYVK